MSDYPQDENNPDNPETETRQPPASVVFMEMMRRAASKNRPQFDDDHDDTLTESTPEEKSPDKVEPPPVKKLLYNTPEERRRAAAIEAERIRRIQRRQTQRKIRRGSMLGGFISAWLLVIISGGLIATILNWVKLRHKRKARLAWRR